MIDLYYNKYFPLQKYTSWSYSYFMHISVL